MIDLSGTSGLPLTLDENDPQLALHLPGDLQPGELRTRSLAELRETLEDPGANGPDPAYYMYNSAAIFSATAGQKCFNWRYDLTVLPADGRTLPSAHRGPGRGLA
jgi:hypothetical protein